jgi:AmmeMemoRadiSam system protein A
MAKYPLPLDELSPLYYDMVTRFAAINKEAAMGKRRTLFWWKTALVTTALAILAGCRDDTGGGTTPPPAGSTAEPEEDTLSEAERAELLQLARTTLESYLTEKRIPPYTTENPHLLRPGGAFVTLKKHGGLRGCIGYIVAETPVYETIQGMAVSAAVKDPRFPPVRANEVVDLTIEISLLSPLELVTDTNRIAIGKHGLLIRRGWHQGVLLPQVAPEQGWDRVEFLEGLCYKAGLPPDAWRDPSTELYWFTAEVFGEGE